MKTTTYVNDLMKKTPADLEQALVDAKKELFNLRFQHATGNLANPMLLNSLKKDIAKIKTVLTERELDLNNNSKEHKA